MYRVKSTDVWHSLPGVVAAYQPIAAPDPFAARQNVAHQGARFGVYTAGLGILPTWQSATGWTFNGTSQYLTTNLIPQTNQTWSLLVRFSGATAKDYAVLCGAQHTSSDYSLFDIVPNSNSYGRFYENGGSLTFGSGNGKTNGIMGFGGNTAYLNGIAESGTIGTKTGTNTSAFYIGARNYTVATLFFNGSIQNIIVVSRVLSPAEMWLASRQMAYCHINPDWNAWARRRRYYYAPAQAAAAAFNPAWARNANNVMQVSL